MLGLYVDLPLLLVGGWELLILAGVRRNSIDVVVGLDRLAAPIALAFLVVWLWKRCTAPMRSAKHIRHQPRWDSNR